MSGTYQDMLDFAGDSGGEGTNAVIAGEKKKGVSRGPGGRKKRPGSSGKQKEEGRIKRGAAITKSAGARGEGKSSD